MGEMRALRAGLDVSEDKKLLVGRSLSIFWRKLLLPC
jgi:hypothetical protein